MSEHQLQRIAEGVSNLQHSFNRLEKHIMSALDNLRAAVARSNTVAESALTLIQGLKTKLDDAIASGDPAAIQQLSDDLGAETDKLAAAVSANTPADPNAPQP